MSDHHHHHHDPQRHNALFTTPSALMLDTRLTPLERNAWQVLRMLRGADGVSPLASLGQLRRYLTTTPLGQRAGYLTARRVLVVLRLTGWISLIGQHRDPMTGHVLSERYEVHELALRFEQASERDAGLAQLLHESVDGEDNQVDRVAMHIRETLEQAPTASDNDARKPSHDDDEPPGPMPPSPSDQDAAQTPALDDSVSSMESPLQTGHAHQMPYEQDSTYKTYMYKKERTYRARAYKEGGSVSSPLALPPCLSNAKTDQQKDVQAALRRLPPAHRQEVLDELQARSQSGTVRNVIAYFFGLIKRVLAGEFRLWAGRKAEQPASLPQQPGASTTAATPRLATRPEPPMQPASRETAFAYLAHLRKTLNMPEHAGELAAQVVQANGWRPRPA